MQKILLISLIIFANVALGQTTKFDTKANPVIPDSAFQDMGVSITPSSMHLSIKPGTTVVKEIKLNNATKKSYNFTVGFNDFEMGRNGKPMSLKQGEGKYGLSKYINISPSYFKMKPGEVANLKVVITIPDNEESLKALWTIVTIDQVVDRAPLDATNHSKRISMGITPSFGFGVYIYQNPPNVKINSVVIDKFLVEKKEGDRNIQMVVKNTGDGIGFCTSYVELTNLNTGKQDKLQVKNFTILPQYFRDFNYKLPSGLPSGKYTAVGVVDFGSSEEIVASETEFDIP